MIGCGKTKMEVTEKKEKSFVKKRKMGGLRSIGSQISSAIGTEWDMMTNMTSTGLELCPSTFGIEIV